MSHTEKCPVCDGSGKIYEKSSERSSGFIVTRTCCDCNGTRCMKTGNSTFVYSYPVSGRPLIVRYYSHDREDYEEEPADRS